MASLICNIPHGCILRNWEFCCLLASNIQCLFSHLYAHIINKLLDAWFTCTICIIHSLKALLSQLMNKNRTHWKSLRELERALFNQRNSRSWRLIQTLHTGMHMYIHICACHVVDENERRSALFCPDKSSSFFLTVSKTWKNFHFPFALLSWSLFEFYCRVGNLQLLHICLTLICSCNRRMLMIEDILRNIQL